MIGVPIVFPVRKVGVTLIENGNRSVQGREGLDAEGDIARYLIACLSLECLTASGCLQRDLGAAAGIRKPCIGFT